MRGDRKSEMKVLTATTVHTNKCQLTRGMILGGGGKRELGEEGLVEQAHVGGDDHHGDSRGEAVVDQSTHYVSVAA